jgi:hypothetical protein
LLFKESLINLRRVALTHAYISAGKPYEPLAVPSS